ncbi:polysaccharide pyruvyl transferase family protein [Thermohalobaculum xanthum]|nr:polysaccharide pyruvyl transferase family protein [Thermohalobaculum xanthum]
MFGWYHQHNAGDDRLMQCIERWLFDHELVFFPHHYGAPPNDLLEWADYVILGGGSIANEVNGVFSDMRRWIRRAGVPVFCCGINVSYHPEFREEFNAVIESGGLIWVRDKESELWLGEHDEIVVGPDISWLYPAVFDLEKKPGSVAVNLRPWEKTAWDKLEWVRLTEGAGLAPVAWPLCFRRSSDVHALERAGFRDIGASFDPTIPSRVELIIAMRFHAVVFAVQAGVPFLALDNTKKLQNLLSQIDLRSALVPSDSVNNLLERLHTVDQWPAREQLLEVREEQRLSALRVASFMKHEIESRAAKRLRSRSFRSLRGIPGVSGLLKIRRWIR